MSQDITTIGIQHQKQIIRNAEEEIKKQKQLQLYKQIKISIHNDFGHIHTYNGNGRNGNVDYYTKGNEVCINELKIFELVEKHHDEEYIEYANKMLQCKTIEEFNAVQDENNKIKCTRQHNFLPCPYGIKKEWFSFNDDGKIVYMPYGQGGSITMMHNFGTYEFI